MAFELVFGEQPRNFLYALIFGVFIGVIYDIFRLSRVALTGKELGSRAHVKLPVSWRTAAHVAPEREPGRLALMFKRAVGGSVFVIVLVQDILFSLISAALFTIFLYKVNFGELRLYLTIGAAVGFYLYYNTIGRAVAAVSGAVISFFGLLLSVVLHKMVIPIFRMAAKAISVPVGALNVRIVLRSSEKTEELLLCSAENGFRSRTRRPRQL